MTRVLHILPKLLVRVDEYGDLTLRAGQAGRRMSLWVHTDAFDAMPGRTKVRQPLPNHYYYVGGTKDTRYGWLAPLPDDLRTFDLVLEWRFRDDEFVPYHTIRHTFRIELLPGAGDCYTMDRICWRDGLTPVDHQPYATLNGWFQPARSVEVRRGDVRRGENIIEYTEALAIPPIPLTTLWTFTAFDARQAHEIDHTAVLHADNEAHRANAVLEMPAFVMMKAIMLARSIPWDRGSDYWSGTTPGQLESHPALRCLCDWWNANAPIPEHRRAGFVAIWARIADDGRYWSADGESPTEQVSGFARQSFASANARIGDVLLVEFIQGVAAATYGRSVQFYSVTGTPYTDVGVRDEEVQSGSFDMAYWSLQGLTHFPEQFPAAWESMLKRR